MTGFHKRKKAKADAARQKAKEREKQERLEERREVSPALALESIILSTTLIDQEGTQRACFPKCRRSRKGICGPSRYDESFASAAIRYSLLIGRTDQDAEDDEWGGVGTSSGGREQDEEYEGEQVVATVTVVEDFDPTTITTGPIPPPRPSLREDAIADLRSTHSTKPSIPKASKPKPRTKKISYQTKDARKHERSKQHARKLEKAALAGRRDKSSKTRGKPRR